MTDPSWNRSVSVVIPAHDAEAFIDDAVGSVLAQTVEVAECIVVDDGSADGTAERAADHGDPVRVVRQENRGVSAARNRGMSEARGRWLAFCDADDAWLPEKLERQLERLAPAPSASAAFCGAVETDATLEPLGRIPTPVMEEVTVPHLLHHRIGSFPSPIPSTLLLSRKMAERVGGWDGSLSNAADWEYAIRLRLEGPFTGPREPLVRYRRHREAMSRDVALMAADTDTLFGKLAEDEEIVERWGPELRRARAWNQTVIAASLWRDGRPWRGAKHLLRSLARDPAETVGALISRGGPEDT